MRSFIPTTADLRQTIRLAGPVAFVQVGMMAMGMVDIIMVGHVSAVALAAVALGNLYFFGSAIFGIGVLMALDPIIAQSVGANDETGVTRGLQRGLLLAAVITIPTTLLLLPSARVLTLLAQPPDVIPIAALYDLICAPGVFPLFAFIVFRQTLQAKHRMRPIVLTVMVANLVNAGLDWIMIYGHWGIPASGVAGAAWASTISRWVMVLLLLGAGWPCLRRHLFPVMPRLCELAPLRRMLLLGVPIGAQFQIEYGAFAFIGLLMGVFGTEQLAGHQVALNLASFTFMVPLGVGSAAGVLIGNAIGAHDPPTARRLAGAALVCGTAFMIVSAGVFITIPTQLAEIYSAQVGVLALAVQLIPIAGIFQIFDGLQVVAGGILRGAGDTRIPMVINLAGFWVVMMPLSWFFGFRTSLGAVGLWYGLVGGLGAVAFLLLWRVRRRFGSELLRISVET